MILSLYFKGVHAENIYEKEQYQMSQSGLTEQELGMQTLKSFITEAEIKYLKKQYIRRWHRFLEAGKGRGGKN